jgi:hypothetical protein
VDLPRHWEDWASWGLALWLLISPWAVDFSFETPATRNAVVAGTLLLALEVVTLSAFRTWEEWANVAVGGWLVVSPFILAVASGGARVNFIVVGGAVVLLALYELWDLGRSPPA